MLKQSRDYEDIEILAHNRLSIYSRNKKNRKMPLQIQRTNAHDDSHLDFECQMQSRQLKPLVRQPFSLNVKNVRSQMIAKKQTIVPAKLQLNAMSLLSLRAFYRQPPKTAFRTRKKLSLPLKTKQNSPVMTTRMQLDKQKQLQKEEKQVKLTKKRRTTKIAMKLGNINDPFQKHALTLSELVQSDYHMLKEEPLDLQIFCLKIKKEEFKRKAENIAKWSHFSYSNVPPYLQL